MNTVMNCACWDDGSAHSGVAWPYGDEYHSEPQASGSLTAYITRGASSIGVCGMLDSYGAHKVHKCTSNISLYC